MLFDSYWKKKEIRPSAFYREWLTRKMRYNGMNITREEWMRLIVPETKSRKRWFKGGTRRHVVYFLVGKDGRQWPVPKIIWDFLKIPDVGFLKEESHED